MSIFPEGDHIHRIHFTQTLDSALHTGSILFHSAYTNTLALEHTMANRASALEHTMASRARALAHLPSLTIDHHIFDHATSSLDKKKKELYREPGSQPEGLLAVTSLRDFYITMPCKAVSDLCSGNFSALGDDLAAPFKTKYAELAKAFKKIKDWL